MKKLTLITVALILARVGYFACTEPAKAPGNLIAQKLLTQVDSFALTCRQLAASPTRQKFEQARIAYKRFEWAAEYFDPLAARSVNGPPVREVELSGAVIPPTGLQMIETLLFSTPTPSLPELRHQTDILLAACDRYRSHFANIGILDWQVFDAARLEVFRVMTLGITGFDNPLTLHCSTESAAALQSLVEVLALYPDLPGPQPPTHHPPLAPDTDTSAIASAGDADSANDTAPIPSVAAVNAAVHYLNTHTDFNSLDRAEFITAYANPLSAAITNQLSSLGIPVIRYNRLLNQDAPTLFDTAAFNVNAYSPNRTSFSTPARVALGQKLFTDASLSLTGTRSCQSCHQPEKAFTDGLVKNTILGGRGMLPRNTPTLLNAALQPAQFADMRAATLEDQARTVVQNNAEMHGDMKLSVQRLWQDSAYRRLFSAAFPGSADKPSTGDPATGRPARTSIDTLEIMISLSSYVRSLVALNSRFDEYMRGNPSALTPTEVRGFNLFMGKARCATCHYMPLFNGAFPPRFVKVDAETIGVPQTLAAKTLDQDPGRFAIVPDPSFRHAFKTPTIRNAARTAPYMHNGVFTTLEQVVEFYDKGGGAGLGLAVSNQTLPPDKLNLTAQERSDLVAFIKSLDSR